MNRLTVSMIISIGKRGIGVPWGRKSARDALVLCQKPKATVPAHRGMAIPRFIESWFVGVNECGNRPSRFLEPMNRISVMNMRDHFCPEGMWIVIICLDVK